MIKLYGSGQSRWVKPQWVLRELAIPFEPILVNLQQGEHRHPQHLARNPFGKTPVLEDGAFRLFESSAICSYLVDAHPNKGLAPTAGTRERAIVDQWISFAVTELEQPLWRIAKNRFVYPEASRLPADIALARDDFHAVATTLEQKMHGDCLVSDQFTLADVTLTYTLRWASNVRLVGVDLLAQHPRLQAYVERHTSRPSFPRELYA
jgi:glutathione S-transferase